MNDYLIYNNTCDFNKEFSNLISEIESNSCGTTANIIRKLRQLENASNNDSNEILTKFMRHLDSEIISRDQDIEKFCNHYYQGFVESIKELLKIQEEASELKSSFGNVQKSLQDSVRKMRQDCSELSKCNLVLTNIDKAIENMQSCLPVFDLYIKAEKSISDKRYFPALKTLNHLELNQMQKVRQFSFSDIFLDKIPGMREQIKAASKEEIKGFLENVRNHSAVLGLCAMKQMALKTGMDINFDSPTKKQFNSTQKNKFNDSKNTNPFSAMLDEPDTIDKEIRDLLSMKSSNKDDEDFQFDIESTNVEDRIDFGPVYRCLHIHSVLGDRHEFEKCYRTQRQRQCTLLLTLTKQESTRNYYEFFSGVVGFFVVEDYIRYSQISMVTKNYLDELWSHTQSRVGDFVSDNSQNIHDIETLLKLKDSCVLFGKTMRSLGFSVAKFKDFYEILRKINQNLLGVEYGNKFKDIFEGEDYTAIIVQDASEMELVLDLYPNFLTPDIDLLPYPKHLSFSWMVPRIYQAVKEHIKKCRKFADNLELSQTELEDQLNHTTNIVFSQTLKPYLLKAVKNSERELNRLIQLLVNMDELQAACTGLQNFISMTVGTLYSSEGAQNGESLTDDNLTINPPRSRLHAFALFKDLHSKIEDSIYIAINAKIDDMFDDNEYQAINSPHSSAAGSLTNSPHRKSSSIPDINQTKPSDFITDVIAYLQTTFESFTNLPALLAQTACLLCCKYINEKLKTFVDKEPRISERFLQQLSVDIKALQEFTRKIPVAGVSPETLILVFEELRQLTDLVLLSDWNTYIQCHNKSNNPYDRVFTTNAISLLEKSRQNETKLVAMFKSLKKNKQDKRFEEILKVLKDLR